MGTIPSVQLFRNSIIITGRTEAIKALEAQKAKVADGGLILARYSEDGTENGVKTLLGIVRNGGGTNVQLTVIDVEGAAQNVQKAIEKAINDLNKADNAVDGQYVASVSEEKGIITVTRKDLPSLNKTSDSGKAITAITQTNGLVSVEFGGVAAANVSVADTNNKFTATNVEGALLEIKDSLDAAIGVGGTVGTQIANAISGISGTTEITDGKVITAISQTKGIVSVSTATLGADKVSASKIESSDTTVAVTGTKVSEQIASLATSIKTVESGKTYTISALTPSEENVKEAFALVDGGGNQAGQTIKIYKDSSLVSLFVAEEVAEGGEITIGNKHYSRNTSGQTLIYEYLNANGNTEYAAVDLSNFLLDSEYGDGLQTSDGVISVKKDSASEGFLTVGADGVKLSGVQTAINTAAAAAKTKVEKKSNADKITLESAPAADGSVTYTIGQNDIASAALLGTKNDASTAETAFGYIAKEVAARTAAIGDLNLTQVGGEGKVITTISQSSGKVSVTAATLGAENVSASTITDDGTKVAVTGDNVKAQIASLATSIKSASTAAAAAHTEVKPKTDKHVRVSVSKSSDNTHDVVTITEDDIASATALEDETTNRQNADTELSNRLGDDVTTDLTATAQLRALSGSPIDGKDVTSVYGAKAYAKDLVDNLNAEVGSTTGTSKTEAIKIVQAHGKIDSITLGAFDCGTY